MSSQRVRGISAPVPVNVIAGPLGVGKTSAIARLLIGWRRDNRIEVQLEPGVEADWLHWDIWWREMLA